MPREFIYNPRKIRRNTLFSEGIDTYIGAREFSDSYKIRAYLSWTIAMRNTPEKLPVHMPLLLPKMWTVNFAKEFKPHSIDRPLYIVEFSDSKYNTLTCDNPTLMRIPELGD